MRVSSEGKWASLREGLADHGLKRKSFVYLTKKQLEETQAILALVSKELSKALKDK
jgi:5-bromo-4-chloroindolyl phosphate hydrolysis protein